MKNKIIFTGTHGTGKTTILNLLFEKEEIKNNYVKITEVFRKLTKDYDMPLNKESTEITQTVGFNRYLEYFLLNKKFISDRGLLDVLAYSLYLFKRGNIDLLFYHYQLDLLKYSIQENLFDTIFYFPIKFSVINDGIRSMDEEFRKEIDENIRIFLYDYKIPYIEILDISKEERLNQILNKIK